MIFYKRKFKKYNLLYLFELVFFQKILISYVSILLAFFVLGSCNFYNSNNVVHELKNGTINLSKNDFSKNPIVTLNGIWKFYWNEIGHLSEDNETLVYVPSSWDNYKINNIEIPSEGFATYKISILMNEYSKKIPYGIRIRDIGTAYKVYWNGSMILETGRLGKDSNTHIPESKSQIGYILDIKSNNELVIEVSNFSHRKGGLWSEIEFGIRNNLEHKKNLALFPELFSIGALFIMGFYHLTIFSIRKKDLTSLYFGLFCLTILFRPLTTEERFIYNLLPNMSWEIVNKIEYLCLYFSAVLFNFFFTSLYKREVNKFFMFILSTILLCLIFLTIIFYANIYSNFVIVFQFIIVMQGIYVLLTLIKIIILKEKSKRLAVIGLFGFILFFLTIVNDILNSKNIVHTDNYAHIGLIFFILSQSYLLSFQISKTFSSVEKLSGYLRISNRKLISLKKNLESIVEERTKELKEKTSRIELVGRMTSMIVHDLKNPISSIIGFAELADDNDIGRQTRSEYLKIIEIEAYRLSDMSHDILDFVKGEFKIKKEMVLIRNFIDEILKFIQPDLKQYKILVNIDCNYNGIAYLDSERMRRVFLNIFSNSVDALISQEKENPTFSIKTYEENNILTLTLSDNGPGIPEQIKERLFQPFATYGKYNGTGLGMAQVKGIIEAHNGNVSYTSNTEGTSFYLQIPISREVK
jgi:two-component system sensor histidine kinase ChiS